MSMPTINKQFILTLDQSELDWLLFEILDQAEDRAETDDAKVAIRTVRDEWWDQVAQDGYAPF